MDVPRPSTSESAPGKRVRGRKRKEEGAMRPTAAAGRGWRGDVPVLCLDRRIPRGWVRKTHAHGPPPEPGEAAGGGTQMSWDERSGSVVVRTPVWEASREKSRYFHPENLPQALCPHVLFLIGTHT